ncbi:delta-endotoxin CytB [Marasmius fiardii PR-910]|nr:delta-endotoxin CytB [Marasmius fiardii PR-910]KAF9260470.1 delta-endotoxin CytB [Marasmius fiardii PR-910]
MSTPEEVFFDEFSKLPGHLVPTSLQVAKFASHYLDLNPPKSFQWPKFQEAVASYRGDDLALIKYDNNTIYQQERTVEIMVDKIVDFLKLALGVVLSAADIAALTQTILTTFTNLKVAESKNFADFTKTATNSSWQYRIQFAFPNPDLPDYFYSLVTTIKLQAAVHEETWWFGLKKETSSNFSAEIDSMRLAVQKGFKDPRAGSGTL